MSKHGETGSGVLPGATVLASRLSSASWISYCISLVAVALVAESVPFMGKAGFFAAGGRPALRLFVLCVPLAVSAVLWAVGVVQGSGIRLTKTLWVLAGLALLLTGSTAFAIDRRVAVFGYWLNEQGLIAWLSFLGLAFLGSQLITTKRRLIQLSWSVVGAGFFVAALALAEVAGARPFPGYSDAILWVFSRGSSTMINSDFLGTFLVLPAVVCVALAMQLDGWRRWLAAGAGIGIWLSLLYSLTRGALAGAIVCVMALFVLRLVSLRGAKTGEDSERRNQRSLMARVAPWAAALGAVIAGVLILGHNTIQERVAQTIAEIGSPGFDLGGRLGIWSELWPAVWTRPILGAGADNIVFAWQPFAGTHTLSTLGSHGYVDSAHNFYLDTAVQFGPLFAVILAATVIWLLYSDTRRAMNGVATGSTDGWVELGWISAMIAIGIAYMTAITVLPIVAYCFAGIGVLLALDVRGKHVLSRSAAGWTAALAIGMSLVVGTVGVLSGVSALVGNESAPTPTIRAQRNLAALSVAPWRQFPAYDLLASLQAMSPDQLQALGMTVDAGHRRILAIDSHSAPRLYDYGDYLFMVERDPVRALEYAQRSLDLRPRFAAALMLKGDALYAMNRADEARPLFERAVETESGAPQRLAWDAPWISYVGFLAAEGKTNPADAREARTVLERFKQRFPDSPSTTELEGKVSGAN